MGHTYYYRKSNWLDNFIVGLFADSFFLKKLELKWPQLKKLVVC